jgi:SdpC family antimicrobial peptide
MQNRTLTRIVSPVLLGALALTTGCTADTRSPTEAVARQAALSGEDMFRGVFFGQGPAAALLPELWKGKSIEDRAQTAERAAQVRALQEELVARIAEKDPAFFGQFASTVRSGSHVAVERALQQAATLLRGELLASPTYGSIRTSEELADPVVDIEIAIYAVLVVIVFWIDFNVAAAETSAMNVEGLQRDQLVDMVVTRLAAD